MLPQMSASLFAGCCAVAVLVGALVGRPWVILAAAVVWVAGIGVAAAARAFAATGEDSSIGVFFFTGLPTVAWPVCAALGVAARRWLRPHQL